MNFFAKKFIKDELYVDFNLIWLYYVHIEKLMKRELKKGE